MGSLKTQRSQIAAQKVDTLLSTNRTSIKALLFCLYKVLCRSYAQTESVIEPPEIKKMGMNLAVINNLCSVLMSAENLIYFLKVLTQNW
jgi:hypothetical protein